jgi:hypothetical protein
MRGSTHYAELALQVELALLNLESRYPMLASGDAVLKDKARMQALAFARHIDTLVSAAPSRAEVDGITAVQRAARALCLALKARYQRGS